MSEGPEPTEEELQAAYEAQMRQIGVDQILLETTVTLINLGMRRTGLQPGTEAERDPAQVRLAIEGVRALMPVVEELAGPQAPAIREALSQVQLAYVRMGGDPAVGDPPAPGGPGAAPGDPGVAPGGPGVAPGGPGPAPGAPGPAPTGPPPAPGEAGPAQRSGRLWIPGQR